MSPWNMLVWYIIFICKHLKGLSGWLSDKELVCQCRRCSFDPWGGKIPRKRKWQPTPVFLPGNPIDRGAWQATVYGLTKRVGHDLVAKHHHCMLTHPHSLLRNLYYYKVLMLLSTVHGVTKSWT